AASNRTRAGPINRVPPRINTRIAAQSPNCPRAILRSDQNVRRRGAFAVDRGQENGIRPQRKGRVKPAKVEKSRGSWIRGSFQERGRRDSNPQPPDRQSAAQIPQLPTTIAS